MEVPSLSVGRMMSLIHHVFLPPKLPDSLEEDTIGVDTALVSTVGNALLELQNQIPSGARHAEELKAAHDMIARLQRARDDGTGFLREGDLCEVLADVFSNGGSVALPIVAQNAGVHITKQDDADPIIETFELSPSHNDVISTKGRLRRSFPGPSFSIASNTARNGEFQRALAQVLAQMSCQDTTEVKSRSRKARREDDAEERETRHPMLVTELLANTFMAAGQPVDVVKIGKNTLDEVMWSGTNRPWRRSAVWLLIRVTLQSFFLRKTGNDDLYKCFMLFYMASLLHSFPTDQLETDFLHAVASKMQRRITKLGERPMRDKAWMQSVNAALKSATDLISKRWDQIQAEDQLPYDQWLSSLKTLDLGRDTCLHIPQLEQYLADLRGRDTGDNTATFTPDPARSLPLFPADALPSVDDACPANYRHFELLAFECWVQRNLGVWLEANKGNADTCTALLHCIKKYYKIAHEFYSGNPESTSNMLLTLLELWVACDMAATTQCKLLRDYDHEIPSQVFQSLLLPREEQMARLIKVETYMRARAKVASCRSSVFRSFGATSSFPVRFFDQSPLHQALKEEIEESARRERRAKIEELIAKTKEYQRLQRLCNAKQCDYATRMDAYGGIETYHHPNCQRHKYLAAAENLEILVHEWPLPDASLEAKSTVFELQVPKSVGAWRDCTLFVIHDLLRCEIRDGQTLDTDYSPKVYKGLSRWARGPANARLGIRSTTKPHIATHGKSMPLSEAPSKSDVCVNNGLNYCYFDNALGIVSDEHDPTDKITELCTYLLPPRSEALQKFLHRSWDGPHGLPPNEAIAEQHNCPEHMALDEFKALASLPLGLEVQWMNILVQLRMPAIEFRQVEASIFVLQVAYQSSPPRGERTGRQGHEILSDSAFSTDLLDAIIGMYAQIKDNWMAYLSLGSLIWITTRLLYLSTDVDVRSRCVSFLGLARPTAMGWARLLSGRAESSTRDAEREQFRGQALDVALVCISTFDVAPDIFHRLTDEAASILFECSILVQEKQPAAVDSKDIVRVLLLSRWRRILYENRERLEQTAKAASGRSPLNTAITQSWSTHDPVTAWWALPKPNQHWLVSTAVRGTIHRTMHFNLLTAEFLINGSPLARLPPDYEAHPMYRVLFGETAIEVMPSTEPGLRFSGKTMYHGHILHFDLRLGHAGNQDLTVRAKNKDSGHVLELLPSRLLQGHFPSAFVERQVHWLNLSDDTIEFRPLDNPWDTSPEHWTLSPLATGGRQLRKQDGCTLVGMNSPSASTFNQILGPLEDLQNIHLVHLARGGLEIELPRLSISFMLAKGSDLLECRQFRDYFVAPCQSIGTLVGLQSRLVVKHKSSSGQMVLIPKNGEIRFNKTSQHVRVKIMHGTADRVQAYEVDNLLGRIVDNGDLPSKLLLCYLHALTSYALPDPLTRHTGTEQALTILDSASILSFGRLDKSSIERLAKISALTPGRQYCPAHLNTMQRVEWNPGLGFLAQHGRFFLSVDRIFTEYQTSLIFYSSDAAKFRETQDQGQQRVAKDLVERDLVYSSFLRLSGFGAEDGLQRQDHIYQGRDTQVNAERCERVFTASYLAMSGQYAGKIPFSPSSDLVTTLWNLLRGSSNTEATQGPNASLGDKFIGFDKSWLKNITVLFIRHWCRLHRLLASGAVDKYAFSTWLATLAYNPNADMQALQALWVIFSRPDVGMHSPPPARPSFNLFVGREPSKHELRSIVNNSLRKFDPRSSPEARFMTGSQETKRLAFEATRREKSSTFVDSLLASWPSPLPSTPSGSNYHDYINTLEIMEGVVPMFRIWHDNVLFYEYLETIASGIKRCQVCDVQVPVLPASTSHWPLRNNGYPFIPLHSVFQSKVAAFPRPLAPHDLGSIVPRRVQTPGATPKANLEKLSTMFSRLNVQAKSRSERAYVDKLGTSLESLEKYYAEPRRYSVNGHSTNAESNHVADLEEPLRRHQEACQENANNLFQNLVRSCEVALPGIRRLPRLSPVVFLSQLQVSRWVKLSEEWRTAIVDYALALLDLQRASRLLDLSARGHEAEFNKELGNLRHLNWNPHEHTEWLLLEVESAIAIRGVQQEIASHMMSSEAGNAVMQLNMGEGKSSVIVPMVATSLADGGRLVRVIVAKAQSKQMLQMLIAKTTGLVNRRIYHFPFSRPVQLTETDALRIDSMLRECQAQRGILLVQPEHILSFKLMCLERYMSDQAEIGRSMVGTQHYLDCNSRDIVDESDEIFSAKFELIYTMGLQRPTELSPSRWGLVHELLDIVAGAVIDLRRELPDAVEIHQDTRWPGRFPRTRLLKKYAHARFVRRVGIKLCERGLRGFPIALQPNLVRKAVFRYLTEARLTDDEVESVEKSSFWTDTTKSPLLLLRGLLAGGILAFTLGSKRWRVNYGPAPNRQPPTQLVVPYQSKDIPSPRSEFSHPDVVILLTSLHYYYAGLSDDELFLALQRLIKADQPEDEYTAWVRTARSDIPRSFQQLAGVSLEDRWQCTDRIFPYLRHSKGAIDYFLSHIVFPVHMKEFPYKISASGWDLGQAKKHATTGFSGTNDARHLLPLSVTQLDLPRQNHTNALVLEYLLRNENSIHLLASDGAEALLTEVVQMQPAVRVILDVGAQVLELSNLQAAQRWLLKLDKQQRVGAGGASAGPPAEAVVFFDDDDVLSVVDRSGRVENLQASPYAKHLDACLVFLDEAHTRGTDLRLPTNYRAAVTLGADLTKDRLVQASMRMRKLGHGQSVVFCIPEEIQDKIATLRAGPSSSGPISVTDVLAWSIHETQQELHRYMPLWAMHGRRFVWQEVLWAGSATGSSYEITKPVAHKFREVEAHSLAQRYLPRNSLSYVAEEDHAVGSTGEHANKTIQAIDDRCRAFASEDSNAAALNEEQERELAPEIEEERQRERPPPATALKHTVHPDVLHFVNTGELREDSTAFVAAFQVLRHTSAAQYMDLDRLPSIPMATADFARTVRTAALGGGADNFMDVFQRTAQFVLTSPTPRAGGGGEEIAHLVLISPFEANELVPLVQRHRAVRLHLYSARFNMAFRPLDGLDLYVAGLQHQQQPSGLIMPSRKLRVALNLFAGQLYFQSWNEYADVASFLGLVYRVGEPGVVAAADGFIRQSEESAKGDARRVTMSAGLKESPVQFLKVLMAQLRRNSGSIEKTHVGKMLDGVLLTEGDFQNPR